MVLIRGLGSQLIHWPEPFVDGLVRQGYRVIRFDNRDSGLSSKFDDFSAQDVQQALRNLARGEPVTLPYSLEDMAADVLGLMDELGVVAAHVVGCSMGGMIAQILAARAPQRALSLISVFSTSGDPDLPRGSEEALASLLSSPADAENPQAVVAHSVRIAKLLGSPAYPQAEEKLYEMAERAYTRSNCPDGYQRQYLAIAAAAGRVALLRSIRAPTLVLHGRDDPLFPVACARSTAEHIPGAKLELIDGWGHDFPEALVADLVDSIVNHARRSDGLGT